MTPMLILAIKNLDKKRLIPYIVIFLTALSIWLPGLFLEGYFNWGDYSFSFLPNNELAENFYSWRTAIGIGNHFHFSNQLPLHFINAALHSLGVSLVAVNHLSAFIPTLLSGIFAYGFASRIIKGKFTTVVSILAALFYMLNPASPIMTETPVFAYPYAFLPLLLSSFVRGLWSDRLTANSVLVTALSSTMVAVTPQFAALAMLSIALILIFTALSRTVFNKKFVLFAVMVGFAINAYWAVPLILSFSIGVPGYAVSGSGYHLDEQSANAYLDLRLRLVKPSLEQTYQHPALFVSSWVAIFLGLAAFIFDSRHRKATLIFSLSALVLVLLSTGGKYPVIGPIYEGLITNMSLFFAAFQNLFIYQFGLAAFLAVLIGISAQSILERISERANRKVVTGAAGALLVLVILVNGSLLFWGQPMDAVFGHQSGMVIPSDYEVLRDIDDDNYRLLVLPWQIWYVKYTWYDVWDMPDFVHSYVSMPVMGVGAFSMTSEIEMELADYLKAGDMENAHSLMQDLSIKYILVHKDIASDPQLTFHGSVTYDRASKYLSSHPGFSLIHDSDNFQIYELDETTPIVNVEGAETNFVKINSALYTGEIESDTTTKLVLGQRFSELWKVKLDGASIPAGDHSTIDKDYGNAWNIPPGEHSVEIYYEPQGLFWASAGLSISFALLLAAYVLFKDSNAFKKIISNYGRRVDPRG